MGKEISLSDLSLHIDSPFPITYQLLGINSQSLFSRQSVHQSIDNAENQCVFLPVGNNTPLNVILHTCRTTPLFVISLPWNDHSRQDVVQNPIENRKTRAKLSLLNYARLIRYFCDLHRKAMIGSYSQFHLESAFEQLVTETHSLLTKETEDKIQVLLKQENPNFSSSLWDDLQRALYFQLVALQSIIVAIWKHDLSDSQTKTILTQVYYLVILLNDDLQNAQIRSQKSIPLNWDIKTILFQLLLSSLNSSAVVLGSDKNSLAEPLSLLFLATLSLEKQYSAETLLRFVQGWEKREKYYNKISTLPSYPLWLSRLAGKDQVGDLAKNFVIYDALQSLFYQYVKVLSEQLTPDTSNIHPVPEQIKQLLPIHAALSNKQQALLSA